MNINQTDLLAISPLDGRYSSKLKPLQDIFSECGLIFYRLTVEIQWLINMCDNPDIAEARQLRQNEKKFLNLLLDDFSTEEALKIKEIEAVTNHDVKAVEYYLRDKCSQHESLQDLTSFIHFGCTSEDINNIAYSLMLKTANQTCLQQNFTALTQILDTKITDYRSLAMLARTHGQPASPTTLGKEFAVFNQRLKPFMKFTLDHQFTAKFNGAVGNFNAHLAAYPNLDWQNISDDFIKSLGLQPNHFTTQIEPHDDLVHFLYHLKLVNTILIDLSRDCWGYISLKYFSLKQKDNEVGSSTMPHKVNPIDFENAEGNLGLANSLIDFMSNKLPISRWQRDLSDSTVMRNLGVIYGHSVLAYQSLCKGLEKLEANPDVIAKDLDNNWEVLAEAIQTVLRRHGQADAYEQLKALTRGKTLNQASFKTLVQNLNLPDAAKASLLSLTPATYIGFIQQ